MKSSFFKSLLIFATLVHLAFHLLTYLLLILNVASVKNAVGESAVVAMNASRAIVGEPEIAHGGYTLGRFVCEAQREYPKIEWAAVQTFPAERMKGCISSVSDLLSRSDQASQTLLASLAVAIVSFILNAAFCLFEYCGTAREEWSRPSVASDLWTYGLSRMFLLAFLVMCTASFFGGYDRMLEGLMIMFFACLALSFSMIVGETLIVFHLKKMAVRGSDASLLTS